MGKKEKRERKDKRMDDKIVVNEDVEKDGDDDMPTREEKFFGFCPLKFVDDVYNVVDDYFTDATTHLETYMIDEMKEKRTEEEVKEGAKLLLSKLRSACDRNFDKFEVYVLRNIFALPDTDGVDDILFPASQEIINQENEIDENDETSIDIRIAKLESNILRFKRSNEKLTNDAIKFQHALENATGKLTTLHNVSDSINPDTGKLCFFV